MKEKFTPAHWWNGKFGFPTEADLALLHAFVRRRQGWLYAMVSPEHPEWGLKIGRTRRNPFERAHELANAGCPDHRYDIVTAVPVLNASWAENQSHRKLGAHHFKKEWFKCSTDQAASTLNEIKAFEESLLSRVFNLELLTKGSTPEFVEKGFYPDELISMKG